MKSLLVLVLLGLFSCQVLADCDEARNPDDSDIKAFFKNIGCKVKQGAEDVAEAAKPYTDKIGEGAKDFGNTVAQKYDEIKHRLTDDKPSAAVEPAAAVVQPTERVPLAPIVGDQPAAASTASIAGTPAPLHLQH